jgi:hypothetical protein
MGNMMGILNLLVSDLYLYAIVLVIRMGQGIKDQIWVLGRARKGILPKK